MHAEYNQDVKEVRRERKVAAHIPGTKPMRQRCGRNSGCKRFVRSLHRHQPSKDVEEGCEAKEDPRDTHNAIRPPKGRGGKPQPTKLLHGEKDGVVEAVWRDQRVVAIVLCGRRWWKLVPILSLHTAFESTSA